MLAFLKLQVRKGHETENVNWTLKRTCEMDLNQKQHLPFISQNLQKHTENALSNTSIIEISQAFISCQYYEVKELHNLQGAITMIYHIDRG